MPARVWDVSIDGQRHSVQLIHHYWAGQRRVLLDGQLVASASSRNPIGALEFSIGAHPAEVLVGTNGFTYGYALVVDDDAHIAARDDPDSRLIQSMLAERAYWHDLARVTGLRYAPVLGQVSFRRYRLVGVLDGCPMVIRLLSIGRGYQLMLAVTLRFAPVADLEQLKHQIKEDSAFQELLDDPAGKMTALSESAYSFALSYLPARVSGTEDAKAIQELVHRLRQYVNPLPDVCETPTGKHNPRQTPQLVIVNDSPQILCQACLDDLPNRGRAALHAQRPAPPGRFKAALIGGGIGLIGAFVVPAMYFVMFRDGRFIVLGGLLLFAIIVRIMDRVRGSPLLTTSLLAVALGISASVLAMFLVSLWLLVTSASQPIDTPVQAWQVVQRAWQALAQQSILIRLTIALIGLEGAWLVLGRWLTQRSAAQSLLRPQIEIIGNV